MVPGTESTKFDIHNIPINKCTKVRFNNIPKINFMDINPFNAACFDRKRLSHAALRDVLYS